jgi:uncharacterized protein YgbK (DUF1537 family)
MSESTITKSNLFTTLPPEWPEGLLDHIREKVKGSGRKIVVLDDDPTGTQTVHNLLVLTTWCVDDLEAALRSDFPAFYIITNSRSLTEAAAVALNREIGTRLRSASRKAKVEIELISRSDSTLRGHFPAEIDALLESMDTPGLPRLVVPFFFEGGRYTVNDIHYVAEGDRLTPAGQTAYAQDVAFGYRQSNLRRWVEEKTGGRIPFHRVASISLEDIRTGGPQSVTEQLARLEAGSYCVVNGVSYGDVEVLVAGLLRAEDLGRRFVFRTAASFVRVRCGVLPRGLLHREELTIETKHGGLFVVGSYVPKTAVQLATLQDTCDIDSVEVNVGHLLDDNRQAQEIQRAATDVDRSLGNGKDVVLFTSRKLVEGVNARESLKIGQRISDALVAIVRSITFQPRYLVAKGGITSSDVATKGLGVRRAMVIGQVLPGVPVWKLGEETRYPGMSYIVFPGNVGEVNALAEIQKLMAQDAVVSQRQTRTESVIG